ncbi:MAG: GNAT family N-acetyltransferase [Lachnospiraceae bacterium]|nr:GNAT family N-acetyltransferase [Lachnospiraceae bacterium]
MNVIFTNSLTDKQLQDIKFLEALCNKADILSLGLFTEPELNEYPDMPCFFMIYDDENAGLLAFLSMFVPGDGTAEVSACTHPKHRQKGLFHTLYKKAREIATEFDIDSMIFATSPTQQTAFNILTKYGAKLENTEYLLQYENLGKYVTLSNPTIPHASGITDDSIKSGNPYKLLPAAPDELVIHTDIFAAAFGYPYEAANEYIGDILSSGSDVKIFSFIDTATGNTIGCCFTAISDMQVMPFGICIHPDFQGQKLGQYMMSLLLNNYLFQYGKPILLQVSGSNENALHIYRKLGFKTASQVDYFRIDVV